MDVALQVRQHLRARPLPGRHKMLKNRCNQACSPKTSLIISAFLGT